MTAATPLSELARAEFEARLQAARRQLPDVEENAFSVARPDYGIALAAGAWGQIAWWSRQLGHPRSEWQPAAEKSAGWLIKRIEWIDRAGPPFRRKATDWEGALQTAIGTGNHELERQILAIPVDTADGSLGLRKPFTDALAALVANDDNAVAKAAAEAASLSDDKVIKAKWYPRLGPALQALLASDQQGLRDELNAICVQHVAFAKKGHLRLSEGAWLIAPVVHLLIFARRRGLEVDVDPEYHAQKLAIRVGHVKEWEGKPVGRAATAEAIVDPVPIDTVG